MMLYRTIPSLCGPSMPRFQPSAAPSAQPRFRIPVALAVPLTLALAACNPPAPAPAAPSAVPVTVVTLKSQDVTLSRELSGRVTPSVVAEVRPQVSGIVQKVLFSEGGMVKAGQPLYQIEDTTFRADNVTARATLAKAQAAVSSAKLTAQRTADLVKIDAVSKQENDNAQAALLQAEAEVASAQAAVERSNITLRYAQVLAPASGRIGKSAVTQGALVTADQQTALATVQKLDPIYVDVTQSSAELLALRRAVADGKVGRLDNVPVSIILEDGSRFPHAGRLAFTEVTVDPSTGSYLLRVVVPNPESLLLPGMYVRAVISSAVRKDGLLVPQRGITRDPKGNAAAMVVDASNKVESRTVQVGSSIGDQWLVEGGLKAGDRVIVEGLQKVRAGAAVQVTEAAPTTVPTDPSAPRERYSSEAEKLKAAASANPGKQAPATAPQSAGK